MDTQLEVIEQAKTRLLDLAFQFGPKVLAALLILVAGVMVGRWVGNMMSSMLERMELDITIRLLLVRIVRLVVLVLFAIMALQNLGIELLPLIAGLGIAGAGVALAMQGVLGNLAAGLTIIFTRPYRVGEYISIVDEEGEVKLITLFSTTLLHPDLSKVMIPNRRIVGEILHNFGQMRQIDAVVGVAYDSDLDRTIRVVREVLAANPRVLHTPEPLIAVTALGDSCIELCVRPWVKVPDYTAAAGEIRQAIIEAFRAQGVAIPLPQREIRLLERAA
ncbi:MAG: mechanosensitive ion channel [Burkholderiales bacterium]|nr:mechanosensitive ion channel [Burkholderiales bacterium]